MNVTSRNAQEELAENTERLLREEVHNDSSPIVTAQNGQEYAAGVEYGIKLGRQQIASKLLRIVDEVFYNYGIDLRGLLDNDEDL